MARDLATKPNIYGPDTDYPYGRIKDRVPGVSAGTRVDENAYGDFHQFFARMFAKSGLTYNNFPDNDYVGFQFFEALQEVIKKTKYSKIDFVATSYNPNNNVTTKIYELVAPKKMENLFVSFDLKAVLSAGVAGGTFTWILAINTIPVRTTSESYPDSFAGFTVLISRMLSYVGDVEEGDTIELYYYTDSASDPYATISNLNIEIKTEKAV